MNRRLASGLDRRKEKDTNRGPGDGDHCHQSRDVVRRGQEIRLDSRCPWRQHLTGTMMRDDLHTHFSAGLSQAEHGLVAILLISILPR